MRFFRFGSILLISFFPLYILRFSLFGLPTTLLEFFFIPFFLVWLLEALVHGRVRETISGTPMKKAISLFLIITLMSVLVSADRRGGVGIFRAYFLEPVALFVLLVDLGKRRILYVTDVLLGLAMSAFYLSVLAILQYAFQADWFAPHEIAAGRVSGLFNSANALALYLEPIIFALGVVVLHDFKVSKRGLFFATTLVLSVIAISLSRSLGGLVAFICLLGILLGRALPVYLRFSKKLIPIVSRTYIYFVIGLLVTTLLLVAGAYSRVENLSPVLYKGSDTFLIRMIVWTGTLNLLSEHWIFGAGLGGYKTLYASQYLPVHYDEHLQYPHNIFLNFWTEIGILGLLSFLWIGYCVLRVVDRERGDVRIILYGVIFLIFVHGLVDVPYFKNDLSMEFWTFMSLAFFGTRIRS